MGVTMRPRTNNILASVLIVILGFTDGKSIGDGRLKTKKSLVTENEAQDGLSNRLYGQHLYRCAGEELCVANMRQTRNVPNVTQKPKYPPNSHSLLRSLVHKKKRLFQGANDNGINPDWADGYRISGLTNNNNDDQFSRHTPISDNMMLNPEMGMEKQDAMKKMEVLSLIEAARSSGLPWDYYLSQMYKRSSTSESSMDDNFINLTDIGDLGIDDLLNQPRLLDRETRDDGRRYLMWRKITG